MPNPFGLLPFFGLREQNARRGERGPRRGKPGGKKRGRRVMNVPRGGAAEGFEAGYIYVFFMCGKMFQPFSGLLFIADYQKESG